MSDVNLKSYSDTSYHNEELKSLTRYRFDKVKERAKLKSSVSRLVCILFPELEKLVPTLHMASVYALLSEFPSALAIASAHLSDIRIYEVKHRCFSFCMTLCTPFPLRQHTSRVYKDYLTFPENPSLTSFHLFITKRAT